MGEWQQPKRKKQRTAPPSAGAESLGKWTVTMGFSAQVQQAVQNRSLKELQLTKLRAFRDALAGRVINPQLAVSWRLGQVRLTQQGDIQGLPSLDAVTGGKRQANGKAVPSSPGPAGGKNTAPPRGTADAAAATRGKPEVRTNEVLSSELVKSQKLVEELRRQMESMSDSAPDGSDVPMPTPMLIDLAKNETEPAPKWECGR